MSERPGPVVDVILCTNKAGPYLADALDSVARQTYPSWRLTVVDDGSGEPERIEAVVARIAGAQTIHQAPSGLPAARNRGIGASGAELVTFLDDDDLWTPDRLEAMVGAWRSVPGAVGVFSGGYYMDADAVPFGTPWSGRAVPSVEMLRGAVAFPRIVALAVTRAVLTRLGGFDESFSLAEDNEFILRLLGQGELAAVDRALVGYRRHGANMTNAHVSARRAASERLLHLHLARARSAGDTTLAALVASNRRAYRRQAAADCVGSTVRGVQAHDLRSTTGELTWALRHAPAAFVAALAARAVARL